MKLPNTDRALIQPEKLAGYCLNPDHPEGRHKERVFRSALGMTAQDAPELYEALLSAVRDAEAELLPRNPQGQLFSVEFRMERHGRYATIRSVWIVRDEEDFPRLVTCYVKRKARG